MVPVLPVMPIAVRVGPGIACGVRPISRIASRTRSIWTGVAWLCITTSMVLLPGVCGLVLKDHSKVGPWFDFRQTERPARVRTACCAAGDRPRCRRALRFRRTGLGPRPYRGHSARAVERQVKLSRRLRTVATGGIRGLEQREQPAELVVAWCPGSRSPRGSWSARSGVALVGDPVFIAQSTDAKRLVRLGEMPRGGSGRCPPGPSRLPRGLRDRQEVGPKQS